jgi:hypothetical protein
MQTRTTRSRDFDLKFGAGQEPLSTELTRARVPANWSEVKSSAVTESADTSFGERFVLVSGAPDQVAAERVPRPEARSYADGTVIEVSEASVVCELQLDRPVNVRLPLGLFPIEVNYGTPIRLRIDGTGGVRTPVVEIRAIVRDEHREQESQRMRGYLAALE